MPRAGLSYRGKALLRTTSQSRFARQGRVAAPSVCFAAARILLAAAPTAPPCFRHWRRSSPLPLVGEPLAKPFTLRGLPRPPLGRGGGSASALTERLSSSPFGRGVTEGDGEGKPGRKEPLRSDGQALCQSDAIAVSGIRRQRPSPLSLTSFASSPRGRAFA